MSDKLSFLEYLSEWDPMDFIKKDGAPPDEYSAEAAEIKLKFRIDMSEGDVAKLVHDVFTDYTSIDPLGFKEECYLHAAEIKQILSKG